MRLFEYRYIEDFGHEWYLHLLTSKRLNVVQINVNWDDFPGTFGISVGVGTTCLFNLSLVIYRLRFYLDVLSYYPTDLKINRPMIPQKHHQN